MSAPKLKDIFEPNTGLKLYMSLEGRSVSFMSRVEQVQFDSLKVEVPDIDHIEKILYPGQFLKLEFEVDGGERFLEIPMTISKFESGKPPYCWVKLPPDTPEKILASRRHVRVPVSVEISGSIEENNGLWRTFHGHTVNISAGGMRLTTPKHLSVGHQVALRFQPEKHGPGFFLKGEVVMCEAKADFMTSRLYVAACQFKELSHHEEDMLVGVCFRIELERQKHIKALGQDTA